jgi:hypothetical protein
MMGIGWQDVIVVVGVVAAIAYLVRRRRKQNAPKPSELVGLGRAPKRNRGTGTNG